MKRFLLFLLVLLVPSALAQEVTRLVVLPFNASGPAEPYRIGLATALQRSLNVVDGVYVPPVGDALLVFQWLEAQDLVRPEAIAEAFDASAVVSGLVTLDGAQAEVRLGFAGPAYPEIVERTVTGPLGDPKRLVANVLGAVVDELSLRVGGEDRRGLDSVAAQTPSLPSLSAVGQASLRLPTLNTAELNAAADLDGGSSWVLSERARGLLLSGDEAGALESSLAAIQADPEDIEALVVRGLILLSTGDTATAREAFDAALNLNPSHALALHGRGRTAEPGQAEADFEAALRAYPRLTDAYLDLAALEAQASPQRALLTLRRGVDQVPDSISLKRAYMQLAVRQGDPAGALDYLRGQLQNEATRSPALYALAAGLPTEYGEAALELIREGRAQYPESVMLALSEATLLAEQGDAAAAEGVLQEARSQDPDNAAVANQLAVTQARQGKIEAAKATLESLPGRNEITGVNLAQLYLQAGQAQAAINTLEPLLQRAPEDAELYTLYGVALGRAGRYDQALNALDQALALNPAAAGAERAKSIIEQQRSLTGGQRLEFSGETAAAVSEGLNAVEAGDYAEAAVAFGRARSLSDSGFIAFYEGYALQQNGRVREALPLYERALEDFPESDTVLNNLGFAYLQLGRFDRALEYLQRAATANPENLQAQLNLGGTYYVLDRYAQAVEAWERAIAIDPGVEASLGERLEDARQKAGR